MMYHLFAVLFYAGCALIMFLPIAAIIYGLDWCHRNGKLGLGDPTLARITRQASRRHY
jgi:hypothetical protein